ncbi:AbrB/MazE/SpoVT family DNA-binding domain-containing protein [Pseudomonas fluorescens]|jgi:antitoxin PrlF|nr:AbrB/MazE/SpoVT family DNA-binding domain-containing protein [Pseudomonas fluorescens]
MLIEFSVSNYRSFRDRQSLSMAVAPYLSNARNVLKSAKCAERLPGLLRNAAIYRSNSSGKSSLIRVNEIDGPFSSVHSKLAYDERRLRSFKQGITFIFKVILFEGGAMSTTMTSKGQVTIPKPIRDALHLTPGSAVEFSLNANGEVVLHSGTPKKTGKPIVPDRFEAVRGKADIKWRTDELMALLRGDD